MPRRRLLCVLMAAPAAMLFGGCGYALAGRGSFLPDYIRVVAVPQLQNRSTFYQVEQLLTERIRSEFIGRGKYQVVPEPIGADAVLGGEITSITLQPVAVNEQQLASRFLLTVLMRMSFTDARTSEVLWSNDSFTFREEYDLGQRLAVAGDTFVDQERSTFERMSNDIARTVVTAIVEAF